MFARGVTSRETGETDDEELAHRGRDSRGIKYQDRNCQGVASPAKTTASELWPGRAHPRRGNRGIHSEKHRTGTGTTAMKLGPFEMRLLLETAGFRVRGATRADCVRCEGQSRGTVAFTTEVAYCHRCKWTANTLTLARELGLLSGNPRAASAYREEARRRAILEGEIKRFDAWRESKIRQVSDKYRLLSRAAVHAENVLAQFPDCEQAWDALARFCHAEARLLAAFDWLMFTKASVWLEEDSTPVELFDTWRGHAA